MSLIDTTRIRLAQLSGTFADELSLPVTAANGAMAVVLSTNTIWIYKADIPGWVNTGTGGGGGGGSGSVTQVSVTAANGVSGTVANPTTTPAITLTLGNITPTSVSATGTVTGSNLSGTNTGDQTITLTGDVTGSGTGSFPTTIANNAVNASKINSTAIGNGLTGGSGTSISVKQDTAGGANLAKSINVSSNGVAIKVDNSTIAANVNDQLYIPNGGVTATQIANNTITATQIANGTITGTQITSSVALAGNPTTTTQAAGDNSTKIATTAYVDAGLALVPGTDLGLANQTATTLDVTSSTGTSVTLNTATNANAGLMSNSLFKSVQYGIPVTVGPTLGQYATVRDAFVAGEKSIIIIENTFESGSTAIGNISSSVSITLKNSITWDVTALTNNYAILMSAGGFLYIETLGNSVILYKPNATFNSFVNTIADFPVSNTTFSRGNFNLVFSSTTLATIQSVSLFRNIGNIISTGTTNITLSNNINFGLRYIGILGKIEENADINIIGTGSNCDTCLDTNLTTSSFNFNGKVSFIGTFSDTTSLINAIPGSFAKGIFLNLASASVVLNIEGFYNTLESNVPTNINIQNNNTIIYNAKLNGGTLNINSKTGFKGYGIYNYTVTNAVSDTFINGMSLVQGAGTGNVAVFNGSGQVIDRTVSINNVNPFDAPSANIIPDAQSVFDLVQANIGGGTILNGEIVPIGSIMAFHSNTMPAGWLLCDGSTYSASTYPDLFAVLGTTTLPDLRGYFLRGLGGIDPDSGTRTLGSIQNEDFKSHHHITGEDNYWNDYYDPSYFTATASSKERHHLASQNNSRITTNAIKTDDAGGTETRPKNIAVNYIIKAQHSTHTGYQIAAGANITVVEDSINKIATISGTGNAVWGSITGTLSDQLDLKAMLDAKQSNLGITTVAPTGADYTTVQSAVSAGKTNIRIIANTTETLQITFSTNIYITVGANVTWELPNINRPIRAITNNGITVMIETEVGGSIKYYPTVVNAFLFSGAIDYNLYRLDCTIDISGATSPVQIFDTGIINIYSSGITTIKLPNLNNSGLTYDQGGFGNENCDLILIGGGSNCANVIRYAVWGNFFNSITLKGTFSSSLPVIDLTNFSPYYYHFSVPQINLFFDVATTINLSIGGNIGSIYNPNSTLITCNVTILSDNCIMHSANLGGGTLNINNKAGFKGYGIYNYVASNTVSDTFINGMNLVQGAGVGNIAVFNSAGQVIDGLVKVNNLNPFALPLSTEVPDTFSIKTYVDSKTATTVGSVGADYITVADATAAGKTNIVIISHTYEINVVAVSQSMIITISDGVIWSSVVTGSFVLVNNPNVNLIIETIGSGKVIYSPSIQFQAFVTTNNSNVSFYRKGLNIDMSGATATGIGIARNIAKVYSEGGTVITLPNLSDVGLRYVGATEIIENSQITLYGGGSNCSACIGTISGATPRFTNALQFTGTFSTILPIINTKCNISFIYIDNTISSPLNFSLGGDLKFLANDGLNDINITIISNDTNISNVILGNGTLDVNSKTGFRGYNIEAGSFLGTGLPATIQDTVLTACRGTVLSRSLGKEGKEFRVYAQGAFTSGAMHEEIDLLNLYVSSLDGDDFRHNGTQSRPFASINHTTTLSQDGSIINLRGTFNENVVSSDLDNQIFLGKNLDFEPLTVLNGQVRIAGSSQQIYIANLGITYNPNIVAGSPFVDFSSLNTAFPTANYGDVAFVNSTSTYWYWDSKTSSWIDTLINSLAPIFINSTNGAHGFTNLSINSNSDKVIEIDYSTTTATQKIYISNTDFRSTSGLIYLADIVGGGSGILELDNCIGANLSIGIGWGVKTNNSSIASTAGNNSEGLEHINLASSTSTGLLSSTDWNTFNNKVSFSGTSIIGDLALFSNTTGAIADTGVSVTTDSTLSANSNSLIPTEQAVKGYALSRFENNFTTFPLKAYPSSTDVLLIEDSANSGSKAYINAGSLPVDGGTF